MVFKVVLCYNYLKVELMDNKEKIDLLKNMESKLNDIGRSL